MLTALLLAAAAPTPAALAPSEIVAAAPATDWVAIAPADVLVMELAPLAGPSTRPGPRRVFIQLMPPPFSQGWVGNIRTLAAARWWDGTSINRVQDNYVVQWGDANAEDKAKAKRLPKEIQRVEEGFDRSDAWESLGQALVDFALRPTFKSLAHGIGCLEAGRRNCSENHQDREAYNVTGDQYASLAGIAHGWAFAGAPFEGRNWIWPVHCYGMVGVGRDMPPDTGSGAELYAVIGHAPRHLDRNIALVGRVIEGIEHLSSLSRGTGALGFYEKAEERTPIVSIRVASTLPAAEQPRFEYLSTESASFAAYADARANRRDAFFIQPAGGADICNIPVPVRRRP